MGKFEDKINDVYKEINTDETTKKQLNERTTTVSFIRVLQELEIQMSHRFTEPKQAKFIDKIADIRQEWLSEGQEDWYVDIEQMQQ